MRKVRNEFAHNLNTDFWTDEKCEKSIVKIDEFYQEVYQQLVKECSKSRVTRQMEIANSVPPWHIKRRRYQLSILEQCKEEKGFLPFMEENLFIYNSLGEFFLFNGHFSLPTP